MLAFNADRFAADFRRGVARPAQWVRVWSDVADATNVGLWLLRARIAPASRRAELYAGPVGVSVGDALRGVRAVVVLNAMERACAEASPSPAASAPA